MVKRTEYRSIARLYDILDLPFEYARYRPLRPKIWSGLNGRILDAGIGTGRNMAYYPAGAEVTGVDLSTAMLRRAAVRKRRLGAKVKLVEGDITATSFADNSFDAVVSTFLFCVLEPELQLPALKELARICKPGGEIRILEYAISANPLRRAIMRLWAPWVRFAYGAAFDRHTEQYLPNAGLELVERRFLHSDIIKLLIARHHPSPDASII
ncbi:MAG: methyltransferase domain-containing protein [Alphaproteobacteria bacterium]|jgi:ubiquinone/menaquinone biosynthesis C-methylase UbiE|nr:methyltransferase domain-containing protein [Alphaproteobacteria bacterium]